MGRLFSILFVVLTFLTLGINGQVEDYSFEDTLVVYEGLFEDDFPMHLTLQFDVKNFQRTRDDEKYHPAQMTATVSDSFKVTHPVRLKARGIYRRDHCTVPPFWLNIRYAGIEAEELIDVRKMKMVTRCQDSKAFDNYVLREYLVYQIYNIISPHSFRTRLIRLKYIDTGRKNKATEKWAFLIESEEMMASRMKAKVVKNNGLSMRTVNARHMDLLSMFQFMIGNGDYSVTGRHNLKILALQTPGPSGFFPVPYDFDYTGIVNTHYAVPGEGVGIASVRERYFMGPCRSEAMHLNALNELASYRDEIIDLISNFDLLEESERAEMIGYIDTFFAQSEHDNFIRRDILSTCK